MKTWQPWTITDGTLQLTEWPDHGPGVVVVEGDVFAVQEVAVVDLEGDIVCHTLPPGVGSHDTDPWDYDDVLRDLFRHIDAHPATHYVLRTLHPERVREVWPAVPEVIDDDWCDGSGPDSCPGCGNCCRHRPNVTLSIGPLATQADADRLVPAGMECADLVAGVELFEVPTERIDHGAWLFCERCDNPNARCGLGAYETPLDNACGGPWFRQCECSPVTTIRVSGGETPLHPDWVRDIRDQCAAASVPFVFEGWGEWMPESQGCGQDSGANCEAVWQCVCGHTAYPLTDAVRCGCGDTYSEMWERMVRVGREHSGNVLDGRTHESEVEA